MPVTDSRNERGRRGEQVTWNVLAADGRVFRARARLMYGRGDRPIKVALIAATAQVHALTVVTRKVRDFRPFGVTVLDPFAPR